MIKYKIIIILFMFGFVFNEYNIYADEENPNELAEHYKILIEFGALNPLLMLESINENVFNTIMKYVSSRNIEDYYYGIGIYIHYSGKNIKQYTLREYNLIKNLPEYQNYDILFIVYFVYHYEMLKNKDIYSFGGRGFTVYLIKIMNFLK